MLGIFNGLKTLLYIHVYHYHPDYPHPVFDNAKAVRVNTGAVTSQLSDPTVCGHLSTLTSTYI